MSQKPQPSIGSFILKGMWGGFRIGFVAGVFYALATIAMVTLFNSVAPRDVRLEWTTLIIAPPAYGLVFGTLGTIVGSVIMGLFGLFLWLTKPPQQL